MGRVVGEQYKVPDGVDRSHDALVARLIGLQPSLSALMGKALVLFDDVFPQAPHPADAPESPVYATATVNMCPIEGIPMGRELTVVLGAGKWIRVFRSTDSSPNAFARQQLWVQRPEGEASRRVNVLRTHNPALVDYPYDIETVDYDDKGVYLGFVGGGSYYGEEPFIAEADTALEDARQVAQDHGLVVIK